MRRYWNEKRSGDWWVRALTPALAAIFALTGSGSVLLAAGRPEPPKILAVFVTDRDPGVTPSGRVQLEVPPNAGPFPARGTERLYVVTIYDGPAGPGGFDQATTFVLPDGHVYEKRVAPASAGPYGPATVARPDLASHPVRTLRLQPLGRAANRLEIAGVVPPNATFSAVMLPVEGTWITQHNLYGAWRVEIRAVVDGVTQSAGEATFDIRGER